MSFVFRVGGEAGWGIATAADILSLMCIKLGYYVFSSKDYASQIRGGHNYHTVRVAEQEVHADQEQINLLLALNKETIDLHLDKVVSNGIILFDDKTKIGQQDNKKIYLQIPLTKIEEKLKNKNIHNAVFLGAATKCLKISFNVLQETINEHFSKKPKLKELLTKAAEEGYSSVKEINTLPATKNKLQLDYLNGNDTVAKGAIKAGLTFHAQYPMTPVSGILHNLAKEATTNKNLTVIQPEDEISTINMSLGASFAGARAMTATSGGGFALMVESVGLAGCAEVPLVIIEGQRPGPATGLPTKNEQGDLNFLLSAGAGDFPKVVLAPGTVEECYTETKRAFYLAEKYQLPVLVIVDKHLTETSKSISLMGEEKKFVFDYGKRINIITKVKNADLNQDGMYKRYQDNLERTLPGTINGIYTCAGDEHDEVGTITENKDIRNKMMNWRMGKLSKIQSELPEPTIYGVKNADYTVVGWGSTKGAIIEAVDKLNKAGKKVNYLQIKYMCPFQNSKIKTILQKCKNLILVENNYSAQLGKVISQETGIILQNKILQFDGATFTVDNLYAQLKKIIK